jgi:carboxymethylenebutenolidase
MPGKNIRIRSREGGEFDCYLALPNTKDKAPVVVLACAIFGIDADMRGIADEFASHGYLTAAPDLFWRTVPGPLSIEDPRARERSQPRLENIRAGEADMADTLAEVRKLPQSNGRAIAAGFCYGGPYAIVGPKRLGFDAGVSCHGSQMQDFVKDLEGVTQPVCIIWGDQDPQAAPPILEAFDKAGANKAKKNLQVHVIPGVHHGYMFPAVKKAYHPPTREFSMKHALDILKGLS